MVKTKLVPTIVTAILSLGGAWFWFSFSERQAAQECREEFFETTEEYPTSGGEKMKVEW